MSDVPPQVLRFSAPRGRLIVLLVVCLVLGALGVIVILLNLDNVANLIFGGAAAGLFGIGGTVSLLAQLRTPTLRADADGLRIARIGTAPWADIDRIGTTARGELGIRMRRTDALLAQASRTVTAESLRVTRRNTAYDLVFTARDLGTPPTDAASRLRRFLP